MKKYIYIVLITFVTFGFAQNKDEYLKQNEIKEDLEYLDSILQYKSSYQGLNGYNYKEDFKKILIHARGKKITKSEFGLFLSKTIGKIGDRHGFVKDYDLPESLYFPMAFAPFKDKVLALKYDSAKKEYNYYNSDYPYLKAINGIPIEEILLGAVPTDALAPKKSYILNAVKELRDIETVFSILNQKFSNPISVKLTDEKGNKKEVRVALVSKKQKPIIWNEIRKNRNFYFDYEEKKRNNKAIIEQFFTLKDNIGYIQITSMVDKEESLVFFEVLNEFMIRAKKSHALIIDVRDNGGGTRDLIQELAGYFVSPNDVYVVNAVKQRGTLPLDKELKKRLHGRYLFSKNELDTRELKSVNKFMSSFKPMYNLNSKKFSEYYYYVLNGKKLSKNKYHYNRPIYILANERSFSAASVLVSVFKGLPNIKIVGVNTDGSSGNSKRFNLPNSKLRGKISTMVSFQKDGKILDGIGTAPDIVIERNLNQIFFKEDYQLKKLKSIIKNNSSSK